MLTQTPLLIEVLTALGLIAAPFVLPYLGFAPNTVNQILVWGLFGIGFDILFGYTGLLSFGQSAFYGTGGFVAAYLLTDADFPSVIAGAADRHGRGAPWSVSGRPDRAAAHRHLLRDDHRRDRRDVLLRRVHSAVRNGPAARTACPACRRRASTSASHYRVQHRLVDVPVPRGLLLHRHRDRAAHRALAGRRDPQRDPRQPAARRRGRPQRRTATS